ncbi:MAG: MBL fold metallo-hydrolase [Acidobacteriota bacterium]
MDRVFTMPALTCVLLLMVTSLMVSPQVSSAGSVSEDRRLLTMPMRDGQAIVWYLYHSGWAVKTKEHLLVFDYWEHGPRPPDASLSEGFMNLAAIAGLKACVFVTHAHSDHYDPRILQWRRWIHDITYVFGWNATDEAAHVRFVQARSSVKVGGVEVWNVPHALDGIPESAFLVRTDGITVFHAGDHGTAKGQLDPVFKSNIDYLAGLGQQIDLYFTPTYGGEIYAIQQLSPRALFPMHDGGNEEQYLKFADLARKNRLRTTVVAVRGRGQRYMYGF